MKLTMMMCPSCGSDRLEKRNGGAYCPHCGGEFVAEYLDEQEALLEALGAIKQESLAHARRMLYDAAHAENLSTEQVLKSAREVRKYMPDDFLAEFYEAACNDDARIVNSFLEGVDVSKQGKMFLADVCEFMLSSFTKRNVGAFKSFLERAHLAGVFTGGEYTAYLTRTEQEAEKLDNGVYAADLPRDVFIAYSSRDMAEVNALADYLEGEGLSCFVALRNLRHGKGAAENYQRLLETAMRNCKSVVFVSTEYSRDLSCDALAVELPYLREHRADIYRVEYRPASDSGRTTKGAKLLMEAFFENLEYARTREDVLERLINHKYGLDKAASKPEPAPQPKPQAQTKLSADELYAEGKKCYDAKDYEKAVECFRKAADLGHARAQDDLGTCYYYGEGVPQSYEKAVEWYTKAAEQGNAKAQNDLGISYAFGEGVPQDHTIAVKWYRKAAEQGYANAQNNLGSCYCNGNGVEQDDEEAAKWYKKAAAQGNADAQNNLGINYRYGAGVPQDDEKAVEYFCKAAEQGQTDAQNNLGECFYFGHGVKQDFEEAVKWYKLAAEHGNAGAQDNLAYCYQHGEGVPQNFEKAAKWWKESAEQDYADAQASLAYCYQRGQGVPKDDKKAVEWFQRAAEQDNADAQTNLGICYAKGLGVPQDYEESAEWYRKAAEQGHPYAQFNLGAYYQIGKGVPKNYEKAVMWYKRSAEQGNQFAQSNLGYCYEQGIGVPKNIKTAIEWYEKAAEQGEPDAKEALRRLK